MSANDDGAGFIGWFSIAGGKTWRQVDGTVRATRAESYGALFEACRYVSGDLMVMPLGANPNGRASRRRESAPADHGV
jgi:hypothetical protein